MAKIRDLPGSGAKEAASKDRSGEWLKRKGQQQQLRSNFPEWHILSMQDSGSISA